MVKVLPVPLPLHTPVWVTLPAPVIVKPKPLKLTAAKLNEELALETPMVLAAAKVTVPATVLAVVLLVAKAPAELTPVPVKESVLPEGKLTPFNKISAPAAVSETAVELKPLLLLTSTIPLPIEVVPA